MKLMREVRFSLCSPDNPPFNSWAGWPAASRLSPYLTLRVVITGKPDPSSGFLCNIQDIDRMVREKVIPRFRSCYHVQSNKPAPTGEELIGLAWAELDRSFAPSARLSSLELWMTPHLKFQIHDGEPAMIRTTQCFEFSAAHRLFCPNFSEQKNQEIFGKCANPSGHGHNYLLEVSLAGRPDNATGLIFDLGSLEEIVKERVVDRFDHKHLNLDCNEFKNLNPSMENIAQVIWNLLEGQFAPAQLAGVRVWETPKTYAEITV